MNAACVMNLGNLLRQTARLFPGRGAVIRGDASGNSNGSGGDTRWTWREIDARVDAMVAALRALGLHKGDRILVQSRNTVQMFESCWVAFRLGCVWVPTNWRLSPPEVAYLAASSGAKVMVVQADFAGHVQAVRAAAPELAHVVWIGSSGSAGHGDEHAGEHAGEHDYEALVQQYHGACPDMATVAYDDPLWFFYTSGTTGKPKAGVLTHGQMAFVVNNHLADLIPGTTERDCSIAVAPLSHGAGIHALLNVARGAATVLPGGDRLDPQAVWQLVEKHRVSNLFTVPTLLKMLVEHPAVDRFDHSSLRYVIYAGAPMYRADRQLALQKLGQVLVQYFGLGEVPGCITVLSPSMHTLDTHNTLDTPDGAGTDSHIESCGRPRVGMEVAVLDAQLQPLAAGEIGEICCRGPAVFAGYHANPDATRAALRGGWFHTGDLGKLDARGLLYITGRASDMYISGGSNVYPREVEEVLLLHPGVAEVAVLGVPDPKWGEAGVAVVVRKPGVAPVHAADLLGHLDGRCARYRWPRQFFFWDALPKSGYGKVSKNEVRRILTERGELDEAA